MCGKPQAIEFEFLDFCGPLDPWIMIWTVDPLWKENGYAVKFQPLIPCGSWEIYKTLWTVNVFMQKLIRYFTLSHIAPFFNCGFYMKIWTVGTLQKAKERPVVQISGLDASLISRYLLKNINH